MAFPTHRLRRLRYSEPIRRLVRETRLEASDFILPLFVCPGEGVRREIGAMPGNYQLSIDELVKECEEARSLGLGGIILFGIFVLILLFFKFMPLYFYFSAGVCFLGGIESLAMIFMIPEWTPDLRAGLPAAIRHRRKLGRK